MWINKQTRSGSSPGRVCPGAGQGVKSKCISGEKEVRGKGSLWEKYQGTSDSKTLGVGKRTREKMTVFVCVLQRCHAFELLFNEVCSHSN